jgi:hypothetical protein
MTNPNVCGADFFVPWSGVDNGPGKSPRYNWSSVDDEIQPWIQAGKEVNLIFWAVSYPGGGPASTPSYVLSQVDTFQCGTSAITPVFWEQPFITNYQAFMSATIQKYGGNASIGYIRFGLGTGGETFIVDGFNSPTCQSVLQKYGYSLQVWENYLYQMLDYEKSLNSHTQLMVSLNQLSVPSTDYSLPDAVAARAVQDGIGIGNQGLQQSDISQYQSTQTCGADWCALFNANQGKVPLELQTVFASDPDGSGQTGSLVSLMPFGVQRHAQILEIYFVDWLTAYDPSYSNYTAYHSAYAAAFNSTAQALGFSQGSAEARGAISLLSRATLVNLNAQRIPNSFAPRTFSSLSSMKTTWEGSAPIFASAFPNAVAVGFRLRSSHEDRNPSKSPSHPIRLKSLTCGSEVFENRKT